MRFQGIGPRCACGTVDFAGELSGLGRKTVSVGGLQGVGGSDVVVVNAVGPLPPQVSVSAYVSEPGSVAVVVQGNPGQRVDATFRFLVLPW